MNESSVASGAEWRKQTGFVWNCHMLHRGISAHIMWW